jgi:hypothetical protein
MDIEEDKVIYPLRKALHQISNQTKQDNLKKL